MGHLDLGFSCRSFRPWIFLRHYVYKHEVPPTESWLSIILVSAANERNIAVITFRLDIFLTLTIQ